MKIIKLIIIIFLLHHAVAFATSPLNPDDFISCVIHPEIQEARSLELRAIAKADQEARDFLKNGGHVSTDDIPKFFNEDMQRRKRVGEIFGEGCFNSAEDFSNAALVYQHGEISDHYYQAYIWASRAVQLGDSNSKHMMALAIDRYLIHIGKKQLFGSQATFMDNCYCIEPVENTFPDSLRKSFHVKTLNEQYAWIESFNLNQSCQTTECQKTLEPTPIGTVPGLW